MHNHKGMYRLDAERELMVAQMLRFLILVGGLAYIPSMVAAVLHEFYAIAVVDSLLYAVVVYMYFSKKLRADAKTAIMVLGSLAVGVVVLFQTGPQGAGYIWLICAVVLTALFTHRHLLVIMVGLMALTMLVYALLIWRGVLDHGYAPTTVLVITSNLLLISLVLAYLIFRLITRMQYAYRDQAQLSQILSDELGVRDRLMHELQHRVHNNLQIMSSLLHFQFDEPHSDEAPAVRAARQETADAMRLQLYALIAVNEVYLAHPERSEVPLSELAGMVADYCMDSIDALRCTVAVHEPDFRLHPHNALMVGVTIAVVLARLARPGVVCRMDARETGQQRQLVFALHSAEGVERNEGSAAGLPENLDQLLLEHAVVRRVFDPDAILIRNNELLLDVTALLLDEQADGVSSGSPEGGYQEI